MRFDEIFDLTAGVYFHFCKNKGAGGVNSRHAAPWSRRSNLRTSYAQRRETEKRERARESGHNEHNFHGEGMPAVTLLRQDRLAMKRLRKASGWRGLHLVLRGQLR